MSFRNVIVDSRCDNYSSIIFIEADKCAHSDFQKFVARGCLNHHERGKNKIMKIKKMTKSAMMGLVAFGVVASGMGMAAPSFASTPAAGATIVKTSATSTALNMVYPIKAKDYRISSHFGNRCAPVLGASFFHGATDLAAKDGTPIYASLDGKVTKITQASGSQVAGLVAVDYGTVNGKNLTVSYNHMWDATKYVKLGQTVKKGQIIAEVGSSGASTGPHLHMSTSYGGVAVDAIPLFKSLGLDLEVGATSVAAKKDPTICKNLYAAADMGLKKSSNILSDTIAVLKRNDQLEVTPGPSVNGFIKAKDVKTGKEGYLVSNNIDTKNTTAPALTNIKSTTANVRYTVKGDQNVRSYPSTLKGESGVLDTLQRGELFTTTGRTSGIYTEIKFALGTGWVNTSMLLSAPDPAKLTGTKTTTKNVLYTPNASVNLFSYPDSSTTIYREYAVNIKTGGEMRTTGRVFGSFTEVTYSGKVYWASTAYIHRTTPAMVKTSSLTKGISYKTKAVTELRNYPSSDNTVSWSLASVSKSAVVKSAGRQTGSWIEVTYSGKTGWMKTEQIARQSAALPKLSTTTKGVSYKVTATSSQMRNYPSTSEVQGWNLKTIAKNTIVKTTGRQSGSYLEVVNGTTTGWVPTSQMARQAATLPKVSSTTKSVYYKINVSSAQLRNYPSASEVQGWNLKTVKKNAVVTTTGKKYGSYIQVKNGSTTGWVKTSQIARTTAPLPKTTNTTKNVTYKAKSTQKIMTYPSTSTAKGLTVATIKKNVAVKTTGKKYGTWLSVKYGSKTGWINSSNFKK